MQKAIALLLLLPLCGCLLDKDFGGTGGINYEMSAARQPVPGGGKDLYVRVLKHNPSDHKGTLVIDGVSYGEVHSGNYVVVTKDSKVLVNGEERGPASASAKSQPAAESQPVPVTPTSIR